VQNVIPTLTSKKREIYLLMASAKQLMTLILSWFRPGALRPTVMCSGHYIALHRGARRGGLQARRERRSGLQVPEVLIEASANIAVKAESVRVFAIGRPPVARGLSPPFIGQGGGSLQVCHTISPTCRGMAYSVTE
jgi:hypothetical protein